MFGYVKPHVPSLTVAEHEVYKGTYCGLCRAMGAAAGQLSRMSLSYDFAFLALFRMALNKTPSGFDRRGCIAHPFSKRFMMKENSELVYAASASVLLTLEKIRDNIEDETGLKRLGAKALLPAGRSAVSRLPDGYAELRNKLSENLSRLSEIEKNKTTSIDAPADVFAEVLGDVFSFGLEGDSCRIAEEVGRRVGKIIYVLDAADDLAGDIKGEKYNPIALIYESPVETNGEKAVLRQDIARSISTAVGLETARARAAFSLADTEGVGTYAAIVSNVLEKGIAAETQRVLFGTGDKRDPVKYRF